MADDHFEFFEPESAVQLPRRQKTRAPRQSRNSTRPTDARVTDVFFDRRDAQNKLKTDIIVAFLKAYAAIILRSSATVRYVDLFAGRGYYDGCNVFHSDSRVDATAIAVLRAIMADRNFAQHVQTWFNEGDEGFIRDLEAVANSLGISSLAHRPVFTNYDVSYDQIAKLFGTGQDVPTFAFVDPWGYKGLTRNLVAALLKDWGCDVAFFFNYRRVNMGLGHEMFDEHFEKLFGEDRLTNLRLRVADLGPEERETIVISELREALRDIGARHVLVFRFRAPDGRTSHHLVFASKHERGFFAMREKMAYVSAKDLNDIPYFEFVAQHVQRPSLFETAVLMPPRNWPFSVRQLAEDVATTYRGKTIAIEQLLHDWLLREDLPYESRHYKAALWLLHAAQRVEFIPSEDKKQPRRGSVPDKTRLRFT